nr:hypothetical protein [Tanacetum cinerariifolium]
RNIQGVFGALDGAATPSDDQDMIKLVIRIDNLGQQRNIQGVFGALDGAATPSDDQDMIKLVIRIDNLGQQCNLLDSGITLYQQWELVFISSGKLL